MKIVVVINPRSGKGRAESMRAPVETSGGILGHTVAIKTVEAPGDGTRFAREAIASGAQRVISIGGDGTLNAVAAGLAGSEVPLGVVPMGSGNGYARSLGLPRNPEAALQLAFAGTARPMDVCYLNDRLFLGTAGIGFDARVAREFDQRKGRGMWNYAQLIIRHILGAKPMRTVTKANDQTREDHVLMLVFCNTREFGNGAVISPGSRPDDGLAELRIVSKPPLLPMLTAFMRMYTGRIDGSPYITSIATDRALVHQEGTLAHLDGEPVEIGHEVRFRLEPKKLWVVCSGTGNGQDE
ncbi:MAG: diacylglycerol kinase family lipid kinase [Flavobacteriales bacterium]|nr:diacylglycerol kinase family lipid kinase [Flavobacteriales bacterium]MBP9079300.1 diacylglycerol kinase family lipid kinase [Flavobacteriales bacterium]